ncbi:deoxyribose-phosphate aldolase [Mesotoga sp. Brook.08.YT.4.2.5.1]|jgi:deoxyribose-phosphate aldolase|uniref:deoxyribose-phosphate aldolase n=1 Tax=unclassified Mesotoga TaxID=1184398 RepID=UPI000B0B0CD3|nr:MULTISPECIES: deoxyribose-phosphate aldolase [unclassified Mesotoga]RAM58209.1 deoxyribose-phosphate aldolase [Mesotoga sp. SC_4PWL113PWK15]MDD3460209.1 deoxyribose-phosphate aldolase [Mesotoga sp.]PNE23765.1 deoxyribose-phosphate aldolase [Mesotoga sp. Brook.08.YT.4.2.5.1]PVD17507.1 deoxyribose-phosphate aldolase [Mesotoga sp. Brook.08.105.5.1]RAO96819.1 deoxyribose-phosphate aldolase [Mesotoga sp. Brook.08.YT.4.2.5.4.]
MKNELAFNRRFDNTLLNPEARWEDIEKFVDETLKYNFRNVVVPWYAIPTYVIDKVQGTEVGINVGPGGFPLGMVPTDMKMREVEYYLSLGETVTDFDIVINVSAVKSNKWDLVEREFVVLSERVKKGNRICKFIIETSRLTEDEIVKVCELIVDVPTIDFVKTGTGFGPRATSYRDVELINSVVAGKKKIKVSGGVRTLEHVEKFMELGATVFGSSASVSILKEYEKKYGS